MVATGGNQWQIGTARNSSGQSRGRELYVINADGSGAYRLTDWPGADAPAAWLPTGDIVFSHFNGDELLPKWFLLRPDGSRLRSLPWLRAADPIDWIVPRRFAQI